MSEKSKVPAIRADVAELLQLFGPPPLLPTENFAAYVELVGRLLDSVVYPDPVVKLLVNEVAVSTFEAARIARHKILVMHRRVDDRLKYQMLRSKESMADNDAAATNPPPQTGKPSGDPEEVLEGLVEDIDQMLLPSEAELNHARALEVGIVYYERLNNLEIAALRRRNLALEQIERWVEGLGHTLRQVSDKVIEASANDTSQTEVAAPPISSGSEQ